jgi:hypothetical protein
MFYSNLQRELRKPSTYFGKFQQFFCKSRRQKARDTNLGNYILPDELCQTKFPLHIRLLLEK